MTTGLAYRVQLYHVQNMNCYQHQTIPFIVIAAVRDWPIFRTPFSIQQSETSLETVLLILTIPEVHKVGHQLSQMSTVTSKLKMSTTIFL